MAVFWDRQVRRVVKHARRFGLSKPEVARLESDARRWLDLARAAGHADADIRLILESECQGHCRLAVFVADAPFNAPSSSSVH